MALVWHAALTAGCSSVHVAYYGRMDDRAIVASAERLEELASRMANGAQRASHLTNIFVIIGLVVTFSIVVLTMVGVIKFTEPSRIISITTSVWCTVIGYYFGKTGSRETNYYIMQAKELSRLTEEVRVLNMVGDQNELIHEIRALRNNQQREDVT